MKPRKSSYELAIVTGMVGVAVGYLLFSWLGPTESRGPGDLGATEADGVEKVGSRSRGEENGKLHLRNDLQGSGRESLIEKVQGLSWVERQGVFRDALKSGRETPDGVFELFFQLEEDSSDKIGPSGVARVLFEEMCRIDPFLAIEYFEGLDDGVVRNKSLLGLASNIPANAATKLKESILERGYPEELTSFQHNLPAAAGRYSIRELELLLEAGVAEGETEGVITGYLERKRRELSSENDSVPTRDVEGLENVHSSDPFIAAENLGKSAHFDSAVSRELVQNVSRDLVYISPPKAFDWAAGLKGERRDAALRAVTASWVRLDPVGCSKYVSDGEEDAVASIAAIEIVRFLIEKDSQEAAVEWADAYLSPEQRGRLLPDQ